jgi:ribose 5-phosphate isomerase B
MPPAGLLPTRQRARLPSASFSAGARAALVWNVSTARLAREHNDANVISIGARQHTVDEAILFIESFITTDFSGEERHARRIAQLAEYESTGSIFGHQLV